MSDTEASEYGEKAGVCNECGYRVRPEVDEVAVVGSWDFAHERCVGDSA